MTFCPPAWQAAQLALKTCSPAPTSPAKAGATATPAVTAAPAKAALTPCYIDGEWKQSQEKLDVHIRIERAELNEGYDGTFTQNTHGGDLNSGNSPCGGRGDKGGNDDEFHFG